MNLLFDFAVDKKTNTICVTREFAADLDLVWDAFTKAEILDRWMGPKPWRVETKEMNFREGGRWLYAMVSPEEVRHWGSAEFIEIILKSSFTTRNTFCDENGDPLNNSFSFSITRHSFKPGIGVTTVEIVKKMQSLAELEQFVAMGYKEGTAVVMSNLDNYFKEILTTDAGAAE